MENATMEDKKGLGIGLLLVLGVVVAWLIGSGKLAGFGKLGGLPGPPSTMTPTAAATTQTGTGPLTEAAQASVPRSLIFEIPPPDVPTYYLGAGMQYAQFNNPIDVGGGLKQWGVTAQGAPVVCINPPETYSDYEWM